jgi:hypothetical protein
MWPNWSLGWWLSTRVVGKLCLRFHMSKVKHFSRSGLPKILFQVFECRGGAGGVSGHPLNFITRVFLRCFLDAFDMLSLNLSFICFVNVQILIFQIKIYVCDDMCEKRRDGTLWRYRARRTVYVQTCPWGRINDLRCDFDSNIIHFQINYKIWRYFNLKKNISTSPADGASRDRCGHPPAAPELLLRWNTCSTVT